MSSIFDYLFGSATFMPHGVCLLWRPDLVALHAISDLLIAIAYLTIPVTILVMMRRRRDLDVASRRVATLFAAFIIACALTHLAGLLTLWVPAYGLQGMIKGATAIISVVAAAAIWKKMPDTLELPSISQLRAANEVLAQTNIDLETTVSDQKFELRSVHDRFEEALKGSNITVFTQDKDLRYTWIHNPRLNQTEEQVLGKTDDDLFPPDIIPTMSEPKKRVLETGQPETAQMMIPSEAEGVLAVDLRISPTFNSQGERDGIACTVIDQTEQRLFETRLAALAAQAAETSRRFELALDNSLITVFEQDRDLVYTYIHNPPAGTESSDYIGKSDDDLFNEAERETLVAEKKKVLEGEAPIQLDTVISLGGKSRHFHVLLEDKRSDAGDIVGLIGTAVDLTEQQELQKRLRLVMREMTHRSKNLLAVIQSMARQTSSRSDSLEDFSKSFSARLQSMAASQDLLVSTSWSGAHLEDLVRSQLSQGIDPKSARVQISGPKLIITAQTAQDLGLGLHELTTNAVKYGALSTDHGKVSVTWIEDGDSISLTWREEGGPPVTEPTRKGFGSLLLGRVVGQSLDGTVELDYPPEGVICTITFPRNHIVSANQED